MNRRKGTVWAIQPEIIYSNQSSRVGKDDQTSATRVSGIIVRAKIDGCGPSFQKLRHRYKKFSRVHRTEASTHYRHANKHHQAISSTTKGNWWRDCATMQNVILRPFSFLLSPLINALRDCTPFTLSPSFRGRGFPAAFVARRAA